MLMQTPPTFQTNFNVLGFLGNEFKKTRQTIEIYNNYGLLISVHLFKFGLIQVKKPSLPLLNLNSLSSKDDCTGGLVDGKVTDLQIC